MSVGIRIKERRKELGLSVDCVAEMLGRNRATVYRYESDEIENLPITVLEPLAKILKTTPGYLMGWTENKKSYQEIDQFEYLLQMVTDILENNGYIVRYDDTGLMFIYDKSNKLVKSIPEEYVVKQYEDAIKRNSSFLISSILDLPLAQSEDNFIQKYSLLDNRGKHTVNTVLEMEFNRFNKPHLLANAAHEIEGASDEDKAHDDDIMDDDNF